MGINPSALARMFFAAIICGAALELFWECLGFIGCAVRYRRSGGIDRRADGAVGLAVIFIKDILYFVICGVVIAVLIYWTNDGQFRFLAFAGVLTGFFVCYKTLGKALRRLNEELVKLLYRILGVVFYPLRKLAFFVMKLIKKAAIKEKNERMRRYTVRQIHALDEIRLHGAPGAEAGLRYRKTVNGAEAGQVQRGAVRNSRHTRRRRDGA